VQPAGGSGTVPGPTPPQLATYWLAAHRDTHVHDESPQVHVACWPELQLHPLPLGDVHWTLARDGLQAFRPSASASSAGQ
jgi:hypothetical protein